MRPDPGLDRLVDGVLLPGFVGTSVPTWLAERVDGGLAGVCLFSHNVVDADQVRALTAGLRAVRPGVLVASDEEGGDVTRLEAAEGSSWPAPAALGHVDDPELTRAVARSLGAQARRAGVDLVLGPVADVGSDPDNPVIGVRAFGADPDLVARHVAAAVRGLHEAGVSACPKHFPGHGGTRTDSHVDLPVVDVPLEVLRRRDLPPFAAAVQAGARAVLTAHVVIPALDDAPATLSRPVLSLLRQELGFDGALVSDALDMQAVSRRWGRGPGAVLALRAGVDLLCIGNPRHPEAYDDRAVLDEVRDAVRRAVHDGDLPLARLEEAAGRVRALAAETAARVAVDGADGGPTVGAGAAARALETSPGAGLRASAHVVDLRGRANAAAGPRPADVLRALRAADPATTAVEGGRPRPAEALTGAADRELVVVVDCPGRDREQAQALGDLLRARPDAVVVHVGLPHPGDALGERWVRTRGGGRASGEAAARALVGA